MCGCGSLFLLPLIIHAKDDALVSCGHAENAHGRIRQSKLILFDTGGHAMLSQMIKVREYVRGFLKEIPASLPVDPVSAACCKAP